MFGAKDLCHRLFSSFGTNKTLTLFLTLALSLDFSGYRSILMGALQAKDFDNAGFV
jgi:hypothetical protein